MLGILVILIISWAVLYLFKESIYALGFVPVKKRLTQFLLGFAFTSILCLIILLLETGIKSIHWSVNTPLKLGEFLNVLRYHTISVVTEDLIFRGALLYILIIKTNIKTALIISSLSFGIYHWFSYGVIGNIVPMIYVLIVTGLTGYAWALAFAKSKSMLIGIGFHLGWNLTLQFFSRGPLGDYCFVPTSQSTLSEPMGSIISILLGLIPTLVTLLFIKRFVREEVENKI